MDHDILNSANPLNHSTYLFLQLPNLRTNRVRDALRALCPAQIPRHTPSRTHALHAPHQRLGRLLLPQPP